ncbi:hypothetical protein AB4156_35585 [Cupriavidus sp. 2MCAB6]|uniref:hypothetical protein n=1 Tax=Cupriavidus sp. 2MCAB6 TaxID=3232981 RepID=UPI003F90CA49
MQSAATSLRALVHKWLGSTGDAMITRVHPPGISGGCVRAQVNRPAGSLAIFFFRHRDGGWCVFPPACRGS